MESEVSCRYCFGTDEPLISPCRCSGSMKYVHPQCLTDWLYHSLKLLGTLKAANRGRASVTCEVCRSKMYCKIRWCSENFIGVAISLGVVIIMATLVILLCGFIGSFIGLTITSTISYDGIVAYLMSWLATSHVDTQVCLSKYATIEHMRTIDNDTSRVQYLVSNACAQVLTEPFSIKYNFERSLDNMFEFWRVRTNPLSGFFNPMVWFDRYIIGAIVMFNYNRLNKLQFTPFVVYTSIAQGVGLWLTFVLMILGWGYHEPTMWLLTFGFQAIHLFYVPFFIVFWLFMVFPMWTITSWVIVWWFRTAQGTKGTILREYTSFQDELLLLLPSILEVTFDPTVSDTNGQDSSDDSDSD